MVMDDKQTPIQIKTADLPLASPSGPEVLAEERAKANFSVDDLANYIHGRGMPNLYEAHDRIFAATGGYFEIARGGTNL